MPDEEADYVVFSGGIRVFVDGVQVNATDNAGKPLEPIVYNGTTYLPVKAIADSLRMPVKWDGKTSSVYLGKDDTGKVFLSDLNPYAIDHMQGYCFNNDDKRSLGNLANGYLISSAGKSYSKGLGLQPETFRSTGGSTASGQLFYNLNGKYATINGTVAFQDNYDSGECSLRIIADGVLVKDVTVTKGDLPKMLKADIKKCLQLKIEIVADHEYWYPAINFIEPVLE